MFRKILFGSVLMLKHFIFQLVVLFSCFPLLVVNLLVDIDIFPFGFEMQMNLEYFAIDSQVSDSTSVNLLMPFA